MSDQEKPEQPGGGPSRGEATAAARPLSEPRGGGSHASGARHRDRRRHREPQAQSQPRRPDPAINMDELRELVDLIAARGLTEFELEREGFRVRLCRDVAPSVPGHSSTPHAAPAHQPSTSAPLAPATSAVAENPSTPPASSTRATDAPVSTPVKEEELHLITSPIVGTFYRASSPTSDAFVRPGSHVEPDTVVCIIEAMKLMNEIQAETTGVVEKIFVENGQPVEYGQPLFGIKK